MILRERDYIRDGDEIYAAPSQSSVQNRTCAFYAGGGARRSRIIHACGMVEIAKDIVFHPRFAVAQAEP